jgi:hypothetical protein
MLMITRLRFDKQDLHLHAQESMFMHTTPYEVRISNPCQSKNQNKVSQTPACGRAWEIADSCFVAESDGFGMLVGMCICVLV